MKRVVPLIEGTHGIILLGLSIGSMVIIADDISKFLYIALLWLVYIAFLAFLKIWKGVLGALAMFLLSCLIYVQVLNA